MTRKYRNVHVLDAFYVSSSGHATFTICWDGGSRDYCPQIMGGWDGKGRAFEWNQAPQYLTAEAERCIVELLTTGEPRPYEYDRESSRRYDDLRYWGDEVKASIISICTPKGASR